MVVALENLAKGAFANALLHLEAIGDVIVHITDVLTLVIVEATVLGPIRSRQRLATVLTLQNVKVEHLIVLQNLRFFIVKQVFAEVHDDVTRLHGEFNLERPFLVVT